MTLNVGGGGSLCFMGRLMLCGRRSVATGDQPKVLYE